MTYAVEGERTQPHIRNACGAKLNLHSAGFCESLRPNSLHIFVSNRIWRSQVWQLLKPIWLQAWIRPGYHFWPDGTTYALSLNLGPVNMLFNHLIRFSGWGRKWNGMRGVKIEGAFHMLLLLLKAETMTTSYDQMQFGLSKWRTTRFSLFG